MTATVGLAGCTCVHNRVSRTPDDVPHNDTNTEINIYRHMCPKMWHMCPEMPKYL